MNKIKTKKAKNFKKFRMKLIESTSYEESLETLNNIYKIYKESKVIAWKILKFTLGFC